MRETGLLEDTFAAKVKLVFFLAPFKDSTEEGPLDSVAVSLFVTGSELTSAGRTTLLVHGGTNMDFQVVGLTKESLGLGHLPTGAKKGGGKAPMKAIVPALILPSEKVSLQFEPRVGEGGRQGKR